MDLVYCGERSATSCVVLGPLPRTVKRGTASGLSPRIWPHLLRLVTNGNGGQAPGRMLNKSLAPEGRYS
jgi:hypothetical protein